MLMSDLPMLSPRKRSDVLLINVYRETIGRPFVFKEYCMGYKKENGRIVLHLRITVKGEFQVGKLLRIYQLKAEEWVEYMI